MKIDRHTKLFFSVSNKPGMFGSELYNAAFKYYMLNALYIPRYCDNFNVYMYSHLASGISVSMPFKRRCIEYIDDRDVNFSYEVKKTGNCNTIIYRSGKINVENTDIYGFLTAADGPLRESKNAVIFGTGAMASSISYALDILNVPHVFVGRNNLTALRKNNVDMLINATPIGMDGCEDSIFTDEIVQKYKFIVDVVVSKNDTNLIKKAKKYNLQYVRGWEISRFQWERQFNIYTGLNIFDDFTINQLIKMGYM